jgi:hypothetical protein
VSMRVITLHIDEIRRLIMEITQRYPGFRALVYLRDRRGKPR